MRAQAEPGYEAETERQRRSLWSVRAQAEPGYEDRGGVDW